MKMNRNAGTLDTKLDLVDNGNGTFEFKSTPTTTNRIHFNILTDSYIKIDGKKSSDVTGGLKFAKDLTAGQLKLMLDNILKGLVNGEAMNVE